MTEITSNKPGADNEQLPDVPEEVPIQDAIPVLEEAGSHFRSLANIAGHENCSGFMDDIMVCGCHESNSDTDEYRRIVRIREKYQGYARVIDSILEIYRYDLNPPRGADALHLRRIAERRAADNSLFS